MAYYSFGYQIIGNFVGGWTERAARYLEARQSVSGERTNRALSRRLIITRIVDASRLVSHSKVIMTDHGRVEARLIRSNYGETAVFANGLSCSATKEFGRDAD